MIVSRIRREIDSTEVFSLRMKSKLELECRKFKRIRFWSMRTRKPFAQIYATTVFEAKLRKGKVRIKKK